MDGMDLKECREEIDRIDGEIIRLYVERMAVADQVAEYKLSHGMEIFDPAREREKIAAARAAVAEEADRQGIEDVFLALMAASRRRQRRLI